MVIGWHQNVLLTIYTVAIVCEHQRCCALGLAGAVGAAWRGLPCAVRHDVGGLAAVVVDDGRLSGWWLMSSKPGWRVDRVDVVQSGPCFAARQHRGVRHAVLSSVVDVVNTQRVIDR